MTTRTGKRGPDVLDGTGTDTGGVVTAGLTLTTVCWTGGAFTVTTVSGFVCCALVLGTCDTGAFTIVAFTIVAVIMGFI